MNDQSECQLIAQIDRIAEKLDHLREKDRGFSVFGSSSHRYLVGEKLTERELLAIEQRLGIELPKQYRLFLARVGEGGAGLFYGLFHLDCEDDENMTDLNCLRKPFRWSEAFNPYDWEDPCGQEDVWCEDPEDCEGRKPQIILNVPGALYICNYGCGIRFFLVVNGQCVGEVWQDSQVDDAGLVPESGKGGRHLGFLDWYEKWLDRAIRAT